jgi:phenylacetate-coenzyme A ligase PaaK-like adenylate-forming protein
LTLQARHPYSEQAAKEVSIMLNPAQIGEAVGGAWRRFRCSPDELRAHQQARLRELVEHAMQHSAFYRRHYGSIDPEKVQLEGLPPVTKRLLQANFDEVVTDQRITLADVKRFCEEPFDPARPWFLDSFAVMLSSGTTGEKGYFVADGATLTDAIAMGVRQSTKPASGPPAPSPGATEPQHRFAAVMLLERFDSAGILVRMIPERLGPKKLIDNRQDLAAVVGQLNEFQPTLLSSFPYTLRLLADEARAGRLRTAPRRITSSGDVLTASDRTAVEGALGVKVYDYYCCTEASYLAWECDAHDGLHLNADFNIVESVDAQGTPVPDGQLGEKILVTNLSNRAMPLIRYEITDQVEIIAAGQPCRCGSTLPRIRTVAGRVEQVISLPSARGGAVPLIPEQIDHYLGRLPANYQVIQEAADRLTLNYVPQSGADSERLKNDFGQALTECFKKYGIAEGINVRVCAVAALEPVRPGSSKVCHYWNRSRSR